MEEIFSWIFRSLMQDQLDRYEQKAYHYSASYGGNCILHNQIRYSFITWNRKHVEVPQTTRSLELFARFEELKKDKDILYAFVTAADMLLTGYANPNNYSDTYLIYYLLPDTFRRLCPKKILAMVDSNSALDKLRQDFIEKYYGYTIKRILIKYQLFDL